MPRKKPAPVPRIISEYQNEYCGVGPKVVKTRGAELLAKKENNVFPICRKTYESQPVGGKKAPLETATDGTANCQTGQSNVALCPSCSALGQSEQHIKEAEMRKLGETTGMAASKCDFCGLDSEPQTVPDVHKLRYLQNRYMTANDWH